MSTPNIVILLPALSYIEHEVMRIDYELETGGLLLGAKLPNSRIITHATPPGPKAIHRPGMFERDLEFSQAAINHFAKHAGIDYIGEWHKHPPDVNRPSIGDRRGVIQTLKDPDYKSGGLIVFPILTRKYNTKLRDTSFHRALVNHYFGIDRDSVQWFPYYMTKDLEFHPFEFQIAYCDLGTQDKVKKFHENYLNAGNIKKIRVPSSNDGGKQLISKANSDSETPKSFALTNATEENDAIGTPHAQQPGKSPNSQVHWYETRQGKDLLAVERRSLKTTSCFLGARILPNGRLIFRFVSPRYRNVFLNITCQRDHPYSFPDLFLGYRNSCINLFDNRNRCEIYGSASHAVEKLVELKSKWEKKEGSRMISGIVETLGFGD